MEQQTNSRFENHLIENREVRIFLSSTFSDMEAERSALVKRFNKLKLEANRRNVSLSLLDLRWGVTDEEARTGKVLSVCLNEIENSHPFFIGLLGSRYGYAPRMSEIGKNPDLEERYPWIREDIAHERSITEIEMQYGVLRNQEGMDAAFFINSMPDTSPDDNEKLTSLKSKIRHQQRFPVNDYTSIEDLCDQVEKAVMALLDKYYSDADNTRLGRERSIQQAYMNSRHKFFVRKQEDFDRLNEFLRNEERHLVVTGTSGIGKSALIANWLKEQEKQEECPYNIIYHFVGNTFGGNSHEEILQHLSDEIFDLYKGIEEKLDSNESPEEKTQRYMTEAIQKGKPMLIVIDGINQISERDNAKLLNWLPQSPKNVKYLFSTLEDDATMQTFLRREYPIYTVEPLNYEQRSKFVVEYLEKVGKHLDDNQLNRILYDPENENTLVLKTMLDELICFGSYEHLNDRIDYYLSATSIPDFFDRMLHRMEDDYQEVRRILSLIAVSEHGLSEEELIAMTGLRQMDFHQFYCAISAHIVTRNGLLTFGHQYLTDAVWNRYHLDNMDSAKPSRESIISYFNSNEISDRNRQISELAFQYYHRDDYKNLYKTIMSFEAFGLFSHANREGLLAAYWRKLLREDALHYQLRDYLNLPIDKMTEELPYLRIGKFVMDFFADSKTSISYYESYYFTGVHNLEEKSTLDEAVVYSGIGIAYRSLGNYPKALEYGFEVLSIIENVLGTENLYIADAYDNIAAIFHSQGDHSKALEYLYKALTIREKVLEQNHSDMAASYNNIGAVYVDQRDYSKALDYNLKALAITERLLGTEHLNTASSYNNIGATYDGLKDFTNALKYLFKALAIREKLLGFEHPDIAYSYNSIGSAYHSKGDCSNALKYYFKALDIRKKVLGQDHPDTAVVYYNIGVVYNDQCDYPKALEYNFKTLAIYEKFWGLENPKTADSYNNIGVIYYTQEDYPKALEYHFKALAIRERVLGLENPDTANSYSNIGAVFYSLDDNTKALDYILKALTIREKVLGLEHQDTANSYDIIGGYFYDQCDYPKALEYHFKALTIRKKVLGLDHPDIATTCEKIGSVYDSLEDYPKALEYHIKALAIREKASTIEPTSIIDATYDKLKTISIATYYNKIGDAYNELTDPYKAFYYYFKALDLYKIELGVEHPNVATLYMTIGFVYYCLRDHSNALLYYKEALTIREKVLGIEHPDTAESYHKIGLVYYKQDDFPNALDYYHKALAIREKVLGTDHPDTATSYNNIGAIYGTQEGFVKDVGCYFKALDLLFKALAIREKILGIEHKDTASSYNNIGYVYDIHGNYTKALEFYLKALDIREKILGQEHQKTAASYNNIGYAYYYQGDYPNALKYFTKLLAAREKLFGTSHSKTQTVRNNIEYIKELINEK